MRILYYLYKQQTWRFIFDTPNCSNYICNDKKTERLLYTLNPIFNEITNEIEKIQLQEKIDFLEGKVSSNLDESLYSELLHLRNQLKRG